MTKLDLTDEEKSALLLAGAGGVFAFVITDKLMDAVQDLTEGGSEPAGKTPARSLVVKMLKASRNPQAVPDYIAQKGKGTIAQGVKLFGGLF